MIQHLGKAGKYIQMSMKYCKESYGHLQCIIQVKREWQTRQFIGIWLQDKNIRVFDQVVFEPPPLVCNNDHFNMWIPFQIAKEPLVETGRDYWQDYCQFLNNLLGDEKIVKFVLARYAFRLTNPGIRTNVILIITGAEGDGKNRLLAPIYNIMRGYTCMLSSAKQLYNAHSKYELQNLFVLVNEASGVDDFENSEILKTRAKEPTLHVNPKKNQAFEINNLCDYDMTTNNQNVVKPTDDSRRRFLQIETTSYYSKNTDFFTDYCDNIEKNPIALRQIYNGLITFDYKSVVPSLNFQDVRYKPTTNIEDHVTQSNRDKIICFFEDWVKDHLHAKCSGDAKYTNDALFKMYIKWCEDARVKMDFNKISFGMQVTVVMKKQLNTAGFSCIKKDTSNSTTTLFLSELIRYFKEFKGFDLQQAEVSANKLPTEDQKHTCSSSLCAICLANKRRKVLPRQKLRGFNPSMIPLHD